MLGFMTSINIAFLPKGSIINISKTIWYEKYSIVPGTSFFKKRKETIAMLHLVHALVNDGLIID